LTTEVRAAPEPTPGPLADPFIVLAGITKTFQTENLTVEALRDVSTTMADGEFVSLVGPSGCGKSTLLRIIDGLIAPTAGSVMIRGEPVRGPIEGVGFAFQTPVLMKWRTVLRNVMFPFEVLRSRGLAQGSESDYRRRAEHLLELVGLVGFEGAYPYQLSGGMQQRVSICRALLCDPVLLLMDEPFGALDEFTRERLNEELLRVWDESKKTVVFVTHHIPEAVFLSDRIVVMAKGPGRIIGDLAVDLPRPRDRALRNSPEFLADVVRVREALGEA
jgi:NitT/TauT family transport system ATP-binding protein